MSYVTVEGGKRNAIATYMIILYFSFWMILPGLSPVLLSWCSEVSMFLKKKKIYWSIVDLQHCVNFCCTAKWLSYTYIHSHILFHYRLSQDIEHRSLCYTVVPCCLSILYILVCICLSQTPNPSFPYPLPLGTTSLFFMSVSQISSFVSYFRSHI